MVHLAGFDANIGRIEGPHKLVGDRAAGTGALGLAARTLKEIVANGRGCHLGNSVLVSVVPILACDDHSRLERRRAWVSRFKAYGRVTALVLFWLVISTKLLVD